MPQKIGTHRPVGATRKPTQERDSFLDSPAWQRLRAWWLRRSPLCEALGEDGLPCLSCYRLQVHHVVDRSTPEGDRLKLFAWHPETGEALLQTLCERHHGEETRRRQEPTSD